MGANFSGQRRKRSIKRCLKNWRTQAKNESSPNITTKRGALLRRQHAKVAAKKAGKK